MVQFFPASRRLRPQNTPGAGHREFQRTFCHIFNILDRNSHQLFGMVCYHENKMRLLPALGRPPTNLAITASSGDGSRILFLAGFFM